LRRPVSGSVRGWRASSCRDLGELGVQTCDAFRRQQPRLGRVGNERLADVVVRAGLHPGQHVPGTRQAGEQDDGPPGRQVGDLSRGRRAPIVARVDVVRRSDPDGDRVVVTFDGTFLEHPW